MVILTWSVQRRLCRVPLCLCNFLSESRCRQSTCRQSLNTSYLGVWPQRSVNDVLLCYLCSLACLLTDCVKLHLNVQTDASVCPLCSLSTFVGAHRFLTFFDLIYRFDVRVNIRRWRKKAVNLASATVIFSSCALLFGLKSKGIILCGFKAIPAVSWIWRPVCPFRWSLTH